MTPVAPRIVNSVSNATGTMMRVTFRGRRVAGAVFGEVHRLCRNMCRYYGGWP